MAEFGFTKQQRLLKASEFQRVFDQSALKASAGPIFLLAASNQLEHPRIGFIIAKKQVRLAVQRNRIKRIVRETFRTQSHSDFNYDVIVMARKGLDQKSSREIRKEFERMWQKLIRLANKNNSATNCA